MSPKKADNPTLESALAELEKLVEKMESGETSLDKSLQLFEHGVELTKICQTKLSQAEQKVKKLMTNKDKLVDFDTE